MSLSKKTLHLQYVPFQYRHYGTEVGWKVYPCNVYVRYYTDAELVDIQGRLDSVWCKVVSVNSDGEPSVAISDIPKGCLWDM